MDIITGERRCGAVVPEPYGAGADPDVTAYGSGNRWQHVVYLRPGAFSGVCLYLAAVYDPACPGGAGAVACLVVAGISRSRRASASDLPLRGASAGHSWHCGGIDIYVLADAGRLYRSATGGAAGVFHWQHGLLPAGCYRQYANGGGV